MDRDLVARRLVRAMIKQVLVDGFFHGDPHPGNLVIDLQTGSLTFLDMGLVGELDSSRRLQLLGLMWALRQRDPDGLATAILGLCDALGSPGRGGLPQRHAAALLPVLDLRLG